MRSLPDRTRYSFWVGGMSLALVLLLWMSSRSTETFAPVFEPGETFQLSTGTFSRGGSLYLTLRQAGIAPAEIDSISRALRKVLPPRDLRTGDRFAIRQDRNGAFQDLKITRDLVHYVVEKSSPSLFSAFRETVSVEPRSRNATGRLAASLWESMSSMAVPPELIMQFSDIFAWNLDFLTECRQGDRYALLWEEDVTPAGKVAGQRVAASLYEGRVTGRHVAILFDGAYYDEEGNSVRKAFLRAPLNFRRISSGFTHRRFHPILRYFRPHLGIDYAAPTGTPVVSVGDGTVAFKGWKPMYGRYVQVRHNGTYSTGYAHFSRYAKNIRAGARVRQGQVLGYVGSSGHATGPHLDFRVIKNGRFVNFLKLKFPPDRKVPAGRRAEFDRLVQDRMEHLEQRLAAEPALSDQS